MTVRNLADQFVRDLKASWQKTAILAVLLVVGMFFWIPPLVRSMRGHMAAPAPEAPLPEESSATAPRAEQPAETRASITWQNVDELAEGDPLVRSAEVAAVESDPFRIDRDQFPPPILFAEEPSELEVGAGTEQESETAPEGITLRSTIVGKKRRAAIINRKLYFEGSELRVGEAAYVVKSIHPRRVRIARGEDEFEITIDNGEPGVRVEGTTRD